MLPELILSALPMVCVISGQVTWSETQTMADLKTTCPIEYHVKGTVFAFEISPMVGGGPPFQKSLGCNRLSIGGAKPMPKLGTTSSRFRMDQSEERKTFYSG